MPIRRASEKIIGFGYFINKSMTEQELFMIYGDIENLEIKE